MVLFLLISLLLTKSKHMKLIHDDLPMEGEENDSCSVIFELEGYVYNIGQLDGPPCWFSRQTVDDYNNDRDNWEKPTGWVNEKLSTLKFLS